MDSKLVVINRQSATSGVSSSVLDVIVPIGAQTLNWIEFSKIFCEVAPKIGICHRSLAHEVKRVTI
jgi:hypothetical protein